MKGERGKVMSTEVQREAPRPPKGGDKGKSDECRSAERGEDGREEKRREDGRETIVLMQ